MAKLELDPKLKRLAKKIVAVHQKYSLAELAEVKALQAAAARRLELGKLLVEARTHWPASGPNAKGWGAFLRSVKINEDVALIAMKYAGYVEANSPGRKQGKLPTLQEAGLVKPPAAAASDDVDRDTWCTPLWIANAIGPWDLDPCSNERSHIQAARTFVLPTDGLVEAGLVVSTTRTFINPPYSNVLPWVERYRHTHFCFLLKLDASTKWCELLLEKTELVLLPRRTRIEFEPPPGVDGDSNQFPHALFYARAEDATPEIRAACFEFTHNRKA